MAGTLYLCATPIGNLEDITLRVLRTLKEVDLIAAEDTRNSIKLLNHFDIHTPMTSFHEYNKVEKGEDLVRQLLEGKEIALITDAGTPGISDPGENLVMLCHKNHIRVTSLPGACAAVTALTMSGLPTRRFAFEAFLPADKKERRMVLDQLKREMRTILLYEAPHHLQGTIEELLRELGNRRCSLIREISKVHEDVLLTDLQTLKERYSCKQPLGECVLAIEGMKASLLEESEARSWLEVDVAEHVAYYEKMGNDHKSAMKLAAADRGVTRREIYAQLEALKGEER